MHIFIHFMLQIPLNDEYVSWELRWDERRRRGRMKRRKADQGTGRLITVNFVIYHKLQYYYEESMILHDLALNIDGQAHSRERIRKRENELRGDKAPSRLIKFNKSSWNMNWRE